MPYNFASGVRIHAGYKRDLRRSNKQEDGGVSTSKERNPNGFKKVSEITTCTCISVLSMKNLCIRHQ